jgi:hypothetical protein
MKLIAHRGNIYGPNPELENKPEYILDAIKNGYDCEIDVRYLNNEYYLGHDNPDYKIELTFLLSLSEHLWIHCKNFEAFDQLIQLKELNIFWHQEDQYTLTSHLYIWAFPKSKTSKRSIILLPEQNNFLFGEGYAICSDYVDKLKNMLYDNLIIR